MHYLSAFLVAVTAVEVFLRLPVIHQVAKMMKLSRKIFSVVASKNISDHWKEKVLIRYAGSLPSPHSEIFIAQMGGATNRVAADATAYRHRDVEFIMNVHGRWETAAEDESGIAWCRELFDAMTPFATGGVYVNFMTEEEEQRVQAAYGDSYDRLAQLKSKYDPTNLFRLNQNIRPSVPA